MAQAQFVGALPRPRGLGQRKVVAMSVAASSATGLAVFDTGLGTIDAGAQVTVQNSCSAAVTSAAGPSIASIVSIVGGTVTAVVTQLTNPPAIDTSGLDVGLLATGY